MFSLIVAVFEIAMIFSFFLFVPTTLIFRLIIAIKNQKPWKKLLLVVFLPFSFGYYKFLQPEEKSKYYNYLIVLFLTTAIIGILFTLYQWIPPFLNP